MADEGQPSGGEVVPAPASEHNIDILRGGPPSEETTAPAPDAVSSPAMPVDLSATPEGKDLNTLGDKVEAGLTRAFTAAPEEDVATGQPEAGSLAGNLGEVKSQVGVDPYTRMNTGDVVGVGTVVDKPEGIDIAAGDATPAILPSPTEDVENEALRKEHPSLLTKDEALKEAETHALREEHPELLTKDEALTVGGETKERRLRGAYSKGEARLNDELDGIRGSTLSDDEKTQAEEDVNRRRSELRAMHGVNERWISPASAETYRRLGNEEDIVAEKVERWATILKRSPELPDAGWDIHRVIEEAYEATMARQNADGVLLLADEVRRDLKAGETDLFDLIQQTGRNQIFGKNIDPIHAIELINLLSVDKSKTIQQVEDGFLEEVQKSVDRYDAMARRREDIVRSLSQGKVPE